LVDGYDIWGLLFFMIIYKHWIIDDKLIISKDDSDLEFSIKVALTDIDFCVSQIKRQKWYTQSKAIEFINILKIFL
jgi:hypothetical protein